MSVINILPPHVADLIAAGEVVERPASVVKELMENAFDAGAKNVTVELRSGGATYIRVTDDGCGMAPEDAGVAFLRHATSKLKDASGLEAIGTMGFRGEALAAISAVSHIELRTRQKGADEGTVVILSGGDILEMGPTGCPEGTTLIVRDLFYNTPARLKFMKSDRSEAAACVQAALRCALGRPEVSVRLIRDGDEEFFSPGDGRADSCIYALLGRDLASTLLPCRGEDEGMKLTGFVSSPSAGRGNRGAQYFFCNGRFIKSQLMQAALEQAYKNTLLTGRYPACVLYLDLGLGSVDVNVHPAKTEVKFSYERRVFDLVYHSVLSALQGEDRLQPEEAKPAAAPSAPAAPAPAEQGFGSAMRLHAPEMPEQTRLDLSPAPVSPAFDRNPPETTGILAPAGSKNVENSVQNVESQPLPDHKILGEALKTYILVELKDQILLIDKHAAHERMNFDRLKQADRKIMSQTLLAPVTLRLDGGDGELLEQNAELLSELGFELEPFGAREYIVRAVPADILPSDAAPTLEEILEKLRRGKAPDPAAARDEILHTVACKAAIKAGWDTTDAERETIVREVLSGRVKYCPHGRPVSAILSKTDLEKMFKRIV